MVTKTVKIVNNFSLVLTRSFRFDNTFEPSQKIGAEMHGCKTWKKRRALLGV